MASHHFVQNKVQAIKRHVLPSGKAIHVVANSSDAELLKRELSTQEHDGEYDVYVRNTPEHLETLRVVQAHHQQRQEEIRSQHRHIFDQLDPIAAELDTLANELSQVTRQNISLDANFDRYGYAAHIRIRNSPEDTSEETRSGALSSVGPSSTSSIKSKSIRFWKKPIVRQYYHNGLLWRASETEQVAAFELFFDLLYVGIIDEIGSQAAEAASGEALLQFTVTFFLAWKIWTELVLLVQWFETDDIVLRISVLFYSMLLLGLATNITEAFESTYTPLIAFFIASRAFQALWLTSFAVLVPTTSLALLSVAVGIVLPSALWIGSIHVEYPQRLALIWIAIAFDMMDKSAQMFVVTHASRSTNPWFRSLMDRKGMVPAINIEHRSERQNAFVTLIFGYMAIKLLYQHSGESSGMDGFFAKAICGLITAFVFNSLYFEIDNRNIETHAIRWHRLAYVGWQVFHLPFVMAFALASGALAQLVVAHDCSNTDVHDLTYHFAHASEAELKPAHRWFYSAGLGVALASMGFIALTHKHRDVPQRRLPKMGRLIFRWAISAIMICLPAAGEHLDSLQLIGTDAGLLVLVLAVDYWGSTPISESFWWDHAICSYACERPSAKKETQIVRETSTVNAESVDVEAKGEETKQVITTIA